MLLTCTIRRWSLPERPKQCNNVHTLTDLLSKTLQCSLYRTSYRLNVAYVKTLMQLRSIHLNIAHAISSLQCRHASLLIREASSLQVRRA